MPTSFAKNVFWRYRYQAASSFYKMIDDIILNKKESIERCVRQIRLYYVHPSLVSFEDDFFKQDAISLNLQRAAEQCIDLANHVVKVKKLGLPKESKDAFILLSQSGLVPVATAQKLTSMVGFRNILVHEYQKLQVKILKDIIENHLDDLISFTNDVLEIE